MNFRDHGFDYTIANNPVPTKDHDAVFVGESSIAVVDGATPLFPITHNSDSEVRKLSKTISELLTESDIDDPVKRFISVSKKIESHQAHTAVAAAVWLSSEYLVCAVIGDCTVAILHTDDSTTVLSDPILENLDNQVVDAMYATTGIPNREAVEGLLKTNRKKANAPDGYGAFGVPGLTQGHVLKSRYLISEVKSVLICSDGFWRSIEPYRIFKNIGELFTFTSQDGALNDIISAIRSIEESDLDARIFKRISPADDISVVLLSREQ